MQPTTAGTLGSLALKASFFLSNTLLTYKPDHQRTNMGENFDQDTNFWGPSWT